ncbi:alpha/beta hydrolase [Clostridium sp.]|uniref:alpha/beta hydrolase n=1 Tax=Clostridium sp. TaxID=1506 RepID=UPI002A91E251|nr:alpha/beta hydrolase [Clostridium sp.]MDY6012049.1 alpha/beta hydrolase [Clostridium sp.]
MNDIVKSYWGMNLKPLVIGKGSDTLAVILPGIGYTLDRVTLEYSSNLALQLGFDVLKIEYGFQVGRGEFHPDVEFNIIAEESFKLLKSTLRNKYRNIVFIGKSIGTCVQNVLNKNVKGYNITNIYISPINKTVQMGIEKNSLVFTGSSDPLLSKENLEKIEEVSGTRLINIDNANHALNVEGDVIKSLEIQLSIIEFMKEYLSR